MNATELKPGDHVIYRAGTKCNDMKAIVVSREMDLGLGMAGLGGELKVLIKKRTREVEIAANDITKKVEPAKATEGAVGDDERRLKAGDKVYHPSFGHAVVTKTNGDVVTAETENVAFAWNEAHQAAKRIDDQAHEGIQREGDGVEEGQAVRVREAVGPGDGQADLQHDQDASVRACPSQAGTGGTVADGRDEVGGGVLDSARLDRSAPGASEGDGVDSTRVERHRCAIIPEEVLERLRQNHYVPDQNDDDINAGTAKWGDSLVIEFMVKKTGERFWRARWCYGAGARGERQVTADVGDGGDILEQILEKLSKS